jgi:hypothetical protein
MTRFNRRLFALAAAMAALVVASIAAAATGGLPIGNSATPDSYQKFLVYMANGTYNPNDPNYQAPTGTFFQKQIMHRSDAEIAQQRADALAFFKERFGLDEANGDVTISSSMFDPRNNYRAYVIGGETVPSGGFVVRDGGINARVTKDTYLHGTFGGAAGKWVAAGTSVTFGDYNILRTAGASDQPTTPLVLHYQSETPIRPPNADGARTFRCELIDPLTGQHGIAQGVIAPTRDAGNGSVQMSIRNVLTFPAY